MRLCNARLSDLRLCNPIHIIWKVRAYYGTLGALQPENIAVTLTSMPTFNYHSSITLSYLAHQFVLCASLNIEHIEELLEFGADVNIRPMVSASGC